MYFSLFFDTYYLNAYCLEEHGMKSNNLVYQYKLLENHLFHAHRRTVVHWMMGKRCVTHYQIFILPFVLLISITYPKLYVMLGTDEVNKTINQTISSDNEFRIPLIISQLVFTVECVGWYGDTDIICTVHYLSFLPPSHTI